MNARELRIGNYVHTPYDRCKRIVGLRAPEVLCVCVEYNREVAGVMCRETWESIDRIEPIPLTEELLLKCGFEKRTWGITTPNLKLDCSFRVKGIDWSLRVEYLHQLQNLFFCLTGEELDVKI